jgi:hypothetical protein
VIKVILKKRSRPLIRMIIKGLWLQKNQKRKKENKSLKHQLIMLKIPQQKDWWSLKKLPAVLVFRLLQQLKDKQMKVPRVLTPQLLSLTTKWKIILLMI